MLGLGNSICANEYPGGWNPTELGSKLIHWYKFNTGITTVTVSSTADQISVWADQKGTNNLAPSVTNDVDKMPKLDTDKSVLFNTATDSLIFSSALTLGKFAIYGRFKSGNFNDRFLQQIDGSEFIKFQSTTEFRIKPDPRHDMAISSDANLANNTKFTAGFERAANGDILASANGLASTTSANTAISNTIDVEEVAAEDGGNLFVYEFVICNDSLSTDERTELNAYLDAI
tara:strand:+ start:444 stop:1136 length:693 start_codon:yes stop_codon:yes gene_type:complete